MNVSAAQLTEIIHYFNDVGQRIRNGSLDLGRAHYALSVAHGALQAIYCNYDKICVVELGVAQGHGLLDLCKAAAFFRDDLGIDIQVYGIDNATGLPPLTDHRDHPEIWAEGQFCMGDPDELRARLPPFAKLLIGDVGDKIEEFFNSEFGSRLGFASIDVDYYSSTKRLLKLFENSAEYYLPATPVYVDDVKVLLTYNQWCGEELAIAEFNEDHAFRKIEAKPQFHVHNFHVLHVLDHPIRTGAVKPRFPFEIRPF